MPDVRDHIPAETVRILARRAREMERLNPHIPASRQIADRLNAEARKHLRPRRRLHWGLLYAAVMMGGQMALVTWLLSKS
ncbi:MAG: hypothetical protein AAGH68_12745 [Pseudomonadota bacterium]